MEKLAYPTYIIETKEHINLEIKNLTEKITQNLLKNITLHSPTNISKDLQNCVQAAINYKYILYIHWQRFRESAIKSVLNHQIQVVRDLFLTYRKYEWTNFLCILASNGED